MAPDRGQFRSFRSWLESPLRAVDRFLNWTLPDSVKAEDDHNLLDEDE
jgi:hypothetical protein